MLTNDDPDEMFKVLGCLDYIYKFYLMDVQMPLRILFLEGIERA